MLLKSAVFCLNMTDFQTMCDSVAPPQLNQHVRCLIAHWCHLSTTALPLGALSLLAFTWKGSVWRAPVAWCVWCASFVVIFKYRWACWLGALSWRCECGVCCLLSPQTVTGTGVLKPSSFGCWSHSSFSISPPALRVRLHCKAQWRVPQRLSKRKPFAASSPGTVAPYSTPFSHSPLWTPVEAAADAAPDSQPHLNSCCF